MSFSPKPDELLIRISTTNSVPHPPGRAANFAQLADVVDSLGRMMVLTREAIGGDRRTLDRLEFYPVAARIGSVELLLQCVPVVDGSSEHALVRAMSGEVAQALLDLVTLIAGTLAIASFPLQFYFASVRRANEQAETGIEDALKFDEIADTKTMATIEPLLRAISPFHTLEVVGATSSARVNGTSLHEATSLSMPADKEIAFLVIGARGNVLDVIADGRSGVAIIEDLIFRGHPEWRVAADEASRLLDCVVKAAVSEVLRSPPVWSVRNVIEVVDAARGVVYSYDQK